MPAIYEKLGLFYLGKAADPASQAVTQDYLLYDSKDLVTHAVCVGMTGSGKTGLCIGLLEEAAIDGIPAVIVDPKGDLGNLALLFPGLRPEDFRPWINEDEAAQKGLSPDEYARDQADFWRRGLAEWGQDENRIRALLTAADISIYTPGSNAGLPLSVLKSFAAPPVELVEDTELFRQQISTTVSGLLGLSSSESIGHFLELGEETIGLLWDKAAPCRVKAEALAPRPEAGASFLPLPSRGAQLLKAAEGDYSDFVARTFELSLWKSRMFNEVSRPGESERDFRLRLGQQAREKRDAEVERLRQRYAAKFATLERQILTAQQRLEREQAQYKEQMTHTTISIGATILGSILGRKTSQIGRATTSARSASRAYYEKMDIERARQQLEMARSRQVEMDRQVEEEASRITLRLDPNAEVLQPIVLRPKKKDIMVQWSGLLWLPFWHLDSGAVAAGFRLA